ncbi:cytochrome C oxidase subunit IV family protein [Chitinophaga sp. GCM10012297]|uniref:Cytochrome C oxidase subunit IV family protein n=1 Tax=Chitinophaga chungangae TaxID=2821488 RepID=A0ABS3YEN1_9BACT|nr:cytochrome C oxidase subunit IV family protein [Chitinophaga chungangae]MBO9153134.1 cytochrome C oxidase subunit IV family protein [Chitinophaga chungangae]
MAHTQNANDRQAAIKSIWKTFWILLIVTMVEVGLAFLHLYTGFPGKLLLNSIFIGLTIVKAFFIVAEFMHLGHEVRNLIMTILFPLLLFVWFIIAFLADGDSWKNMRKDLAPGTPVKKEAPAHAPAHH